jgi:aspartate racemase
MSRPNVIGIIGGLGPAAGVDLAAKLVSQTKAATDQEHLPFLLVSYPHQVADRTAFLVEGKGPNPGKDIARLVRQLEQEGATVVGMACNTAHAGAIMSVVHKDMARRESGVQFLHMVEEVAGFIKSEYPDCKKIGILSTTGTYQSRVYPDTLRANGLETLIPTEAEQAGLVNESIFNSGYGIKAHSGTISEKVKENLAMVLSRFKDRGAQAVVLGCTEFSLVYAEPVVNGLPMIDSNLVLARALIREAAPDKLKPLVRE